jgi:hydroxyethylthiazole kinase-like uncharacterized protein yjeF
MFTSSRPIIDARGYALRLGTPATPLYDIAGTRIIETQWLATLPAHALMERAGLAVARLALAIAPHAKTFWIPCGPGNNGGDGLVAARHLTQWGKHAVVTLLAPDVKPPPDAMAALVQAREANVVIQAQCPTNFDCCIDALFGIGNLRAMSALCIEWIQAINTTKVPVIAVDLPTGLHADTGAVAEHCVHATATLNLLTLKPGSFTAEGRQVCGEIWWDALDCTSDIAPTCLLNSAYEFQPRKHNSHKGSHGDVVVVGGAQGMTGAAHLCSSAALRSGAGRVYLCLLAGSDGSNDFGYPEIMVRPLEGMEYKGKSVVAGCGGGIDVANALSPIIQDAAQLVLDADALNALALSAELHQLLLKRPRDTTVLTPHPLEAARLLNTSTQRVQNDRLAAAQTLADRFQATVVLKGSGSIIATPGQLASINPTGNGLLATGGTGDVLAGMIGTELAAGQNAHTAACRAAFHHGQIADRWQHGGAFTAGTLVAAL